MRLQLWSCNFEPEPTGIGPLSAVWTRVMCDQGHDVTVIAAHPHYPTPEWGRRILPYQETRAGASILRLPLWIGRESTGARLRQELSYTAAQLAATPMLGRPDAMVVVSPSFPALTAAVMNAGARRVPWALWIQDILPDGAQATGILQDGPVLRAARRLERIAYRSADRIIVVSREFISNLRSKAVPEGKIELIYNPATRRPTSVTSRASSQAPRILSMGNIGRSQGLAEVVRAFQASDALAAVGARLVISGDGVARNAVEREISSERVELLGIVEDERLENELQAASLALVSQRHQGAGFNLPSKLMNFMTYGIPVLAAVDPAGETAALVRDSRAGWVYDSSRLDGLGSAAAAMLSDPRELARRGEAGRAFAAQHFSIESFAERFASVLDQLHRDRGGP